MIYGNLDENDAPILGRGDILFLVRIKMHGGWLRGGPEDCFGFRIGTNYVSVNYEKFQSKSSYTYTFERNLPFFFFHCVMNDVFFVFRSLQQPTAFQAVHTR